MMPTRSSLKGSRCRHQLNKLLLFLDKNGLLRLQGRLQHSKSSYEIKHPILLSAKHYVVIKLIEDAHRANFHEGTEYVRSVLRHEILDYCTAKRFEERQSEMC